MSMLSGINAVFFSDVNGLIKSSQIFRLKLNLLRFFRFVFFNFSYHMSKS